MKPALLNARILAGSAAERWKAQYFSGGQWRLYPNVPGEEVYKALVSLGPNPEPEQVNSVIGNDSWTTCGLDCHGCERTVDEVVQVGQKRDYDSSSANLCRLCLIDAMKLVD